MDQADRHAPQQALIAGSEKTYDSAHITMISSSKRPSGRHARCLRDA
jgi:hypothetical protein